MGAGKLPLFETQGNPLVAEKGNFPAPGGTGWPHPGPIFAAPPYPLGGKMGPFYAPTPPSIPRILMFSFSFDHILEIDFWSDPPGNENRIGGHFWKVWASMDPSAAPLRFMRRPGPHEKNWSRQKVGFATIIL